MRGRFDDLGPGSRPVGDARAFYSGLLDLNELEIPAPLAARGVWLALPDGRQLHLGVEEPFRASRKAHPAFLAADLDELARGMEAAGSPVWWDDGLAPRRSSAGRTRSGTGSSYWGLSGVGIKVV